MTAGPCQAVSPQVSRRVAVLAAFALLAPALARGQTPTILAYRGFKIELSGFGVEAEMRRAETAIMTQIDFVTTARLGHDKLMFFRALPLRIASQLRGFLGTYHEGIVRLAPSRLESNNPTLLHEFMHAWHDQKIPGGFANKEIMAAFEDAVSVKRYEGTNSAYFLTNHHEFFAVTATLYLHGSLPYNRPYTRAAIRAAQPDYYKFLERQFGRR